jgi:hypothetical protein
MGALHPVLFFIVVYGISLFIGFFICNTIYNSLHAPQEETVMEEGAAADGMQFTTANTTTSMR